MRSVSRSTNEQGPGGSLAGTAARFEGSGSGGSSGSLAGLSGSMAGTSSGALSRSGQGGVANRLASLVDRLAAEVILRHAAGQRTLDVGLGAPDVARWVQDRAASFEGVPGLALQGQGPTPRLSQPDASVEVVYSMRTLAHLGTDEASSEAAARAVLREMARVLTPGGVALVQIDNPRSLRGLYHGVRNPMTVVGQGALTLDTLTLQLDAGLTRFDTIRRFTHFLPLGLEIQDLHGLSVLTPVSHALAIPVVGAVLSRLEWWARDVALLRRFGAYMLVVLRRREDPDARVND